MKASELKHALTFVDDDDEVEFTVIIGGQECAAEPVDAQITTKWDMPERGELTVLPDKLPKTMTINLEIQ
jgi:hypothetical protein